MRTARLWFIYLWLYYYFWVVQVGVCCGGGGVHVALLMLLLLFWPTLSIRRMGGTSIKQEL